MRTEEAVTEADGIWFSFAFVLLLYTALGTIAIIVLRGCRAAGARAPARGPRPPRGPSRRRTRPDRRTGGAHEQGRRRGGDPLGRGDVLRALRGRRLRRRLLGPDRRRRREGGAAAGADPALADPGLGGQPRLADLHPRRPLDRLPARLQRDLHDPLRADRPGRGGDRPARRRLRLPQADRGAVGAAGGGRDLRPLLGPHPVLHGRRGRRDRLRQRPRRRQRRRLLELAAAAAAADRGDVRRHRRLPRRRLPGRRRAPGRRGRPRALLRAPGAGRGRGRRRRGGGRPGRARTPKPATSSTASSTRACPWSSPPPSAASPCWPCCCAAAAGRCGRWRPAPW